MWLEIFGYILAGFIVLLSFVMITIDILGMTGVLSYIAERRADKNKKE